LSRASVHEDSFEIVRKQSVIFGAFFLDYGLSRRTEGYVIAL